MDNPNPIHSRLKTRRKEGLKILDLKKISEFVKMPMNTELYGSKLVRKTTENTYLFEGKLTVISEGVFKMKFKKDMKMGTSMSRATIIEAKNLGNCLALLKAKNGQILLDLKKISRFAKSADSIDAFSTLKLSKIWHFESIFSRFFFV